MVNVDEKVFFYSVFSPEYDLNSLELGILSKVRSDFFNSNKRQKNQIVKEVNGRKYNYFYSIEHGQPAKWKKILDGKLLEKSRINQDNTYSILYQDENKNLLKISHFDFNHDWLKTEYFGTNSKTVFSKNKDNFEILVCSYKNGKKVDDEYKIYPINGALKDFEFDTTYDVSSFFAVTNFGRLSYVNEEKIKEINRLKKDEQAKMLNTNQDENLSLENSNQNIEFNTLQSTAIEGNNLSDKPMNTIDDTLICKKIIKTDSGETYFYFGNMSGDNREGFGRTAKETGKTIYEGFYKNDKRDGFGVYYYKSGEPYHVGGFSENKKDKLGVTFNKQGSLAQISLWNDDECGPVSSVFDSQGNIFVLKNDPSQKNDNVLLTYNGDSGNIKINSLKNNRVTLLDEYGGLLYHGQIENGLKNGFGTEYSGDGEIKYRGFFKNDLYCGKGTIFYSDHKFTGDFLNGKPNGYGIICKNNGFEIEGKFFDSPVSGSKSIYFDSGVSYNYIWTRS